MGRLEALLDRAGSLDRAGDFKGAVAAYSDALALYPECADAYYGRGIAYLGARDYLAAVHDFTAAIEREPSRCYFFASRALAYYAAGQFTQAISDCDKAIRLGK